jgi:peptidoglycan L-alanyl-D-glutamate endopeptidase CwlK
MPFVLGAKSQSNLIGIHEDLEAIVRLAITLTTVDFSVLEGMRTRTRQAELIKQGVSWTMNSRHLTGHAVDVAPWMNGRVYWPPVGTESDHATWKPYFEIANAMKLAACRLDIVIEWGVDLWKKDAPHYQMSWNDYPG